MPVNVDILPHKITQTQYTSNKSTHFKHNIKKYPQQRL